MTSAGYLTTAAGAAAGAPGFVWGSVSAVISRVFTSRVSAPGFVRGSTSAAKARPLTRRLPRFLSPFLTGYLATLSGGRKFSSTHSSLLDSSLTLNAKRRLSG